MYQMYSQVFTPKRFITKLKKFEYIINYLFCIKYVMIFVYYSFSKNKFTSSEKLE